MTATLVITDTGQAVVRCHSPEHVRKAVKAYAELLGAPPVVTVRGTHTYLEDRDGNLVAGELRIAELGNRGPYFTVKTGEGLRRLRAIPTEGVVFTLWADEADLHRGTGPDAKGNDDDSTDQPAH